MNYAEKLSLRIWKTKGARLEAHKRLEKMNKYSNWAISVSSLYVILISLQSVPQFTLIKINQEAINFSTIFISIFIIIISLIDNSSNYKYYADLNHTCAKKLNRLFERLQYIKEDYSTSQVVKKEVGKIGKKYQKLINEHHENHTQNDFDLFILKDEAYNIKNYLVVISKDTTFIQYLVNLIRLLIIKAHIFYILIKTYFLYYIMLLFPLFLFVLTKIINA
jgi:hypothetical protein